MKLLDNDGLETVAEQLSGRTAHSRTLCRLELYSCKMAGQDKRLFRQLQQQGGAADDELELLSPSPAMAAGLSPPGFGVSPMTTTAAGGGGAALAHTCSRKTLYYLKATLNASFHPDYDFAAAASHEFTREPSFEGVHRSVNSTLLAARGEAFSAVSAVLWQQVADAIEPADTDIYSYNPDLDSDPFATDGALWSFNYFFFNKKLKRILFFTCRTFSASAPLQEGEDDLNDSIDRRRHDSDDSDNDMEVWGGGKMEM